MPSGSGEEGFLKVFAIYGHGGHLGHVTFTIYINFRSPFQRMLHMKSERFQRRISLNIMVIYMYMYIAPGWRQTGPWGPKFLES